MKTVVLLLMLVVLHAAFGQYLEETEDMADGKPYFV